MRLGDTNSDAQTLHDQIYAVYNEYKNIDPNNKTQLEKLKSDLELVEKNNASTISELYGDDPNERAIIDQTFGPDGPGSNSGDLYNAWNAACGWGKGDLDTAMGQLRQDADLIEADK